MSLLYFFINWYVRKWNVNVYLLNVQCDYCWWLTILVFETKDEQLWNDLKREFESTPTMVFSMIGDSESFVPKLWQKDVFQTALVEAAKNGGGMVFFQFMSMHINNNDETTAYEEYDCNNSHKTYSK